MRWNFTIGNKRYGVDVFGYSDKKIALAFPNDKAIRDEVKGFEGATFDYSLKIWAVTNPKFSERNYWILKYLMKKGWGSYDKNIPNERWPLHTAFGTPYDHQWAMANHWLHLKRAFWAAEMGTGKTRAALMVHSLLENNKEHYEWEGPLWVIAPKSALRGWEAELHTCAYYNKYMELFNYEKLFKRMETASHPPQGIIFDESSRIKNPGAKRSQLCKEIQQLMAEYWDHKEMVLAMSGTPSPHNPTDWWNQVETVRPGWMREKNLAQMRSRLGIFKKDTDYPTIEGWKEDEVQTLYQRMQPLVLVLKKKDCLDLPDKVYRQIIVKPAQDVMNAAFQIENQGSAAIEVLTKLRQLSDGFQYDNDSEVEGRDTFQSAKDSALEECLDQCTDSRRVVIYAGFTRSVDHVTGLCTDKGWDVLRVDGRGWRLILCDGSLRDDSGKPNQATFQSINTGPLPYKEGYMRIGGGGPPDQRENDLPPLAFVGHPGAASVGLTLTASSMIVYFSNDFNAENRIQSEDRIHRIGQHKAAVIIDIFHLPTDKYVLDNLTKKRDLQAATMGEISSALRRKIWSNR